MPRYQFEATKTYFYSDHIEADSEEEAREIIEEDIEFFFEDFGPEVTVELIWEAED